MGDHQIVDAARRVASQLDARCPTELAGLPGILCRALKVQEEAGELAQAIIGVLGQNPRKGVTHSWDDVVHEAIDVALTALVLAQSVAGTEDLDQVLSDRLDLLRQRADAYQSPATPPAALCPPKEA